MKKNISKKSSCNNNYSIFNKYKVIFIIFIILWIWKELLFYLILLTDSKKYKSFVKKI
jgi:hypothetical protein